MKNVLIAIVFFLSVLIINAEDEIKISLNFATNLEECFNIISKISGYDFYIDETVQKMKPINMKVEQAKINDVIDILLTMNGLKMSRATDTGYYIFPVEKEKQYIKTTTAAVKIVNAEAKDIQTVLQGAFPNVVIYINPITNIMTLNGSAEDLKKVQEMVKIYDTEELYTEKTFYLSFMKPEEAVDVLSKISRLSKYSTNKALNSITVVMRSDDILKAEKLLKEVDIKPSQTVIEIILLDASSSFTRNLEIKWDDTVMAADVKKNIKNGKIGTILMPSSILASEIKASAEILASPTIRVINNEIAKISIGQRLPIVIAKPTGVTGTSSTTGSDKLSSVPSVEYKDVGIQMEVTPQIHSGGEITIKLNLEVSSIGEKTTQTEYGDYPSFITKNISTLIRLKDGETAIFGGLINNEDRNKKVMIPLLGDIPIIGDFFFSKSERIPNKSEVVMLITPRIVNISDGTAESSLQEYEKNREDKSKNLLKIIK